MSGGGGSQTQVVQSEMPQWMQDAAKENLARAKYASQIGYTPYYGPDVAAMSPMQTQAMQSTGMGMQAFGLAPQGFDPMAGQPQPQTFMGGLQGYSSGGLYDQALAQLQERRPGQYDAISGMFIDPQTGELDVGFTPEGSITTTNAPAAVQALSSGVADVNTGSVSGMSQGQLLQGLADAPGLLNVIPGLGLAKRAAEDYVNKQAAAQNAAGGYSSPYMHTDRGFSDSGNTYTSSYGTTRNTAGMSDATRRGLEIASSQAFDPYGYGD